MIYLNYGGKNPDNCGRSWNSLLDAFKEALGAIYYEPIETIPADNRENKYLTIFDDETKQVFWVEEYDIR
jgi:hypothetical protein